MFAIGSAIHRCQGSRFQPTTFQSVLKLFGNTSPTLSPSSISKQSGQCLSSNAVFYKREGWAGRFGSVRPAECPGVVFLSTQGRGERSWNVRDSVFPGRNKPPGLSMPRKCWWAKEVTPELHVCGRLTERQIKYAAEAGFKSLVAVFTYQDQATEKGGEGDVKVLPSTESARRVAEIAGVQLVTLLEKGEEWVTGAAVERMNKMLSSLPRPTLVYCDRGRAATFLTLCALADSRDLDPGLKVTSDDVYNMAAAMGLDFVSDPTFRKVISDVTGEPVPDDPPRPDVEPADWLNYWEAHPVYRNWFTAGQVLTSDLPVIQRANLPNVINLRPGLTYKGVPKQEEVNLLNVRADTGTYAQGDKPPRQDVTHLQQTRLDASRPCSYIAPDARVNYEAQNASEFGDQVGYNEAVEKAAFEASPLKYHHFPVVPEGPYGPYLADVMGEILDIGRGGPVLVHCAMAKRAAYVAVLAAALQHKKDLTWALKRTRELGYSISESQTPELYSTYVDWLVNKRRRG